MVAQMRRVLVRPPSADFEVADPQAWHYSSRPDWRRARGEHDRLVRTLSDSGVEVVLHDCPMPGKADSIFVFDPVLVTDRGVIALRMGKALREGEEEALARSLHKLGVPILGRIQPPGKVEGGDLLWLARETLVAGVGFRTNHAGLDQLESMLGPGVQLLRVQLPYFEGPEACLHLLSLISLVDERTAVGYPFLMPVPFWELLTEGGFSIIPVPNEEFPTMACNVLAIRPGHVLMLDGNPKTRKALEKAGVEVVTYCGEELSLKAEGGPTCLTLPIWRG